MQNFPFACRPSDRVATTGRQHSETKNPVEYLLQGNNKRVCPLEFHSIAFMLRAKQERCEY